MKFSLEQSILILKKTPGVLDILLPGLDEKWINSNEGLDTWSPFDIVGHLIHGEKTDWLVRIKIILENASHPVFQPFDRFAQFEESKGKNLKDLLIEFSAARSSNLKELNDLSVNDDDLDKIGIHPKFGKVTLKNLIACWAVHDLSHIAQISRVMAKQYRSEVGPWIEYLPILQK